MEDSEAFSEVQRVQPLPQYLIALGMVVAGPLALLTHRETIDVVFVTVMETLFAFGLISSILTRVRTTVLGFDLRITNSPFGSGTRIDLRRIRGYRVVSYPPSAQLLGFGKRRVRGTVKAFLTRANKAVLLELHDGRRTLIGSERADELLATIERASRRAGSE